MYVKWLIYVNASSEFLNPIMHKISLSFSSISFSSFFYAIMRPCFYLKCLSNTRVYCCWASLGPCWVILSNFWVILTHHQTSAAKVQPQTCNFIVMKVVRNYEKCCKSSFKITRLNASTINPRATDTKCVQEIWFYGIHKRLLAKSWRKMFIKKVHQTSSRKKFTKTFHEKNSRKKFMKETKLRQMTWA